MKDEKTVIAAKKLISLAIPPCPIDEDDLYWFKDRRGMAACSFALPIDTPLKNLLTIAHAMSTPGLF